MDWAPVALVLGPISAAIGAYVLAARRMSGKIGTSDAAQLWNESRSIREDYREQLNTANQRTASLEIRVANLEETNNNLTRDLSTVTRENEQLRSEVVGLKELVDQLRTTIDKLQKTVRSQREELNESEDKP